MFARVFNKYSLSFLSLAAASAGLLSCGGSGDSGEGTCLPSGSRLNMVVPITDQVNPDNASSLIIQLDGNDTDLPLAKIQGAAAGTSIVVIFYGSVQVNMDITFNTSSKYETAEGTCTGNVSFVSGIQDGEGAIVAGNPWAGTDGTVFYYPTGN